MKKRFVREESQANLFAFLGLKLETLNVQSLTLKFLSFGPDSAGRNGFEGILGPVMLRITSSEIFADECISG